MFLILFNYPVSGSCQGFEAPAPIIGVVFRDPSPGAKLGGARGDGESHGHHEKPVFIKKHMFNLSIARGLYMRA